MEQNTSKERRIENGGDGGEYPPESPERGGRGGEHPERHPQPRGGVGGEYPEKDQPERGGMGGEYPDGKGVDERTRERRE